MYSVCYTGLRLENCPRGKGGVKLVCLYTIFVDRILKGEGDKLGW